MNYQYISLANQSELIEDAVLRKLKVHQDESGQLVETLRNDWKDVFNKKDLNFAMQYMSKTPSAVARDENLWHVHKFQKDRFICTSGRIVTAMFDPRENSRTRGKLNLCLMSLEKPDEMYMIVIPENVYHGFMVISESQGYLLNFPTKLYNPSDEGRIKHKGELNWDLVRRDFGLEKK